MRPLDEDKKRAVCEASIKLINTLGFAGVSMTKIAHEAGVSPATIYIYFENKEQMINELYARLKYEMSVATFKGFDIHLPIREGLSIIWNNTLQFVLEHPEHFKFIEQFVNSPLIDKIRKEEGRSFFTPLLEFYKRGKKENVFRNCSFELLYIFTFFPLFELVKAHFSEGLVLNEALIQDALDMTWRAMSKDEPQL